ncbi:somatostatin receptor type 1-like [Leucoraja erinacea]|uniref:somatostatin receptor type 1-like n=1 Tax=Leucoraja erinaceus TaxID=7782 RepID=UPI0024551C04|nr:somatostatin receptor type 1-like [Leucoraja erinacea]
MNTRSFQLPSHRDTAAEMGSWNSSGESADFVTALPLNYSLGEEEEEEERDAGTVVIQFISAVVCLVGLVGNAMVIFVILRYAKMKTATNIYILNLAIADELFMLSVPFLSASAALQRWPFGSLMCRTVLSVDGINQFTSVFCLTVLSVDRYVAVVHPIKAARYRRPTIAKVINICVWVLSLIVILPIIIFAGTAPSEDGVVHCNFLWPHRSWSVAFVIYTSLLGFLIPVFAICLCYVLIVVKMRVVALKAGWQQRRRSEKKLTGMVLMVVAVFVICWMPFYVVQLANIFLPLHSTVNQLCLILSYANSCANPFLYGFLSDNFRRSFQRILCFRWLENGSEEPVDYYATALKGRLCNPIECQPGNPASHPLCRNGTCSSRTTTL